MHTTKAYISRLPTELLHIIFNYIDPSSTIYAGNTLNLVCHHWYTVASPFVWRKLRLALTDRSEDWILDRRAPPRSTMSPSRSPSRMKSCSMIWKFFEERPKVAHLVKNLSLEPHVTREDWCCPLRIPASHLLRLVACFPNLRTLRLAGIIFDLDEHAEGQHCPTATTLDELWIEMEDFSLASWIIDDLGTLLTPLHLFQGIKSLAITGCGMENSFILNSQLRIGTLNPESLHFRGDSAMVLLDKLLDAGCLTVDDDCSLLRTLELGQCPVSEQAEESYIRHASSLLETMGHRLHRLSLNILYLYGNKNGYRFASHCPNLSALAIYFEIQNAPAPSVIRAPNESGATLTSLLHDIHMCPNLRTVSLLFRLSFERECEYIDGEYVYPPCNLNLAETLKVHEPAMETRLQHLEDLLLKVNSLKTVELGFVDIMTNIVTHEAMKSVSDVFPRLHERKMLRALSDDKVDVDEYAEDRDNTLPKIRW